MVPKQTAHHPVQVLDKNVSEITSGLSFSLFTKTDGSLWGMGKMNSDSWETGQTQTVSTR